MTQTAVMLVVLVAIYGAVIVVLVRLGRRIRGTNGQAIFLSFLTFGLATGLLVMLLWPHDSSVLPNIFSVWLGDWIYRQAIAWIGNPYSAQAHETIPWIIRVPQVYVSASTGLCAAAGLALQWIFDRFSTRRR
jgi:hypothetical protein